MNRVNELGWKCLLTPFAWQAARQQASPVPKRLKRALLTSFDAVDAGLLVEHILPHWCRVSRDLMDDDASRNPFVVELSESLKSVESFIVVTSTTFSDGSCPYPWLWQSVRWVMVGARQQAVQHAKLWLLEWDEPSILEVCVSSANLTMSSFRDQIQEAWRCAIPLEASSQRHRESWGILPDFVEELADSCAPSSRDLVRAFTQLFNHAICPGGVRFMASVPGTHSKQTLRGRPWGLKGLTGAMPTSPGRPKAIVTAPVVGGWRSFQLQSWLRACECPRSGLTLGWISNDTIQYKGHWTLPSKTFGILRELGASIKGIVQQRDTPTPSVHEQHRSGDPRWLHAKLYGFSRGRGHNTLVTSANFTPAAWGRPTPDGLRIENFELGVLLEGRRYPLELEPLDKDRVLIEEPTSDSSRGEIVWAEAEWDGTRISVEYRVASVENKVRVVVVLAVADGIAAEEHDRGPFPGKGTCRRLQISWPDSVGTPVQATLKTTGETTCTIPVRDSRDFQVRISAPLPQPGLDEKTEECLREQLLLERYNAALTAAEGDAGEDPTEPGDDPPLMAATSDYSVLAFEQAREWFAIIDEWQKRILAVQAAKEDNTQMRILLSADGRRLKEYFERQGDQLVDSGCRIAASLVVEEMHLRLQNTNTNSEGPAG